MPDIVTFEIRDNIAVIQMDDGKANALSPTMSKAIGAGLDIAAVDAKAIVLTGRPGVLCGGYDLRIIRGDDSAERDRMRALGTELMKRLYLSPQPIVWACTGHAVAAGAILLMAGAVRIGRRGDFKIGLNETAIGLPLPQIGLEFARDRLSPSELQAATIMAKLYNPDEAVSAGYLDHVTEGDVFIEAIEEAKRLAQLDAIAFAATKNRLRQPTIDRVAILHQ